MEEIQRDEVLQNVVDKYTTATGFNTVEKATAGATAIFRQVESLTDLEPNDIPRYNEVLLKLGLLASRATTLKGFKESIQKQISGLGTNETFAKTQKDRQKR